jgi:hypothetical protein
MRNISEIAREIRADWTNIYFGARPYLQAMECINAPEDPYCADNGKTIVLYFLSNATSWRGETARRVKAELKQMIR